MNRFGFLSLALIFCIGMILPVIGLSFSDWGYWMLLILIVFYGLMNREDGKCVEDVEQ